MLNKDYKEMLSTLLDHDVKFIVVGAYALAMHGYPRATMDLDVWVQASTDNAQRVVAALKAFGAPADLYNAKDFEQLGLVYQIGIAPRRIDILTDISGVNFDDAWKNRIASNVEQLEIPVLSKADLITNKLNTGRDKDLLDVKELRKLQD